jgi:phospholipase A1
LIFYSQASWSVLPEQACLIEQLKTADDNVTIGDLKAVCQALHPVIEDPAEPATPIIKAQTEAEATSTPSALVQRIQLERQNNNPFSLLPHKPNYLIISNNIGSPNERPFNEAFPNKDTHLQPWETKFQISFKVPVVRDLFNKADLFIAYTNRSFFQQFNKEDSAPFRDSNHEPEVWLSFKNNAKVLGFQNRVIRTGFSHQSNGQSGSLSRSWNRVYVDFLFERDNWYFSLKPWWRVPEDSDNDDNPDIDEFLGNFELGGIYKHQQHNFSFLVRNNLRSNDNHGAVELGWSFPISKNVRGYAQWFNGYGESLIDYDAHTNSLGFGIQLTDWL